MRLQSAVTFNMKLPKTIKVGDKLKDFGEKIYQVEKVGRDGLWLSGYDIYIEQYFEWDKVSLLKFVD